MPTLLTKLLFVVALSLPLAGLFSFHPAAAAPEKYVKSANGACPDGYQRLGVAIDGKDCIYGAKENQGQALLENYFGAIFNWGVGLISALAVLVIIAGGYRYMTSGGSPDKIESAKNMIVGALSGLLLVIFAWVILRAINPGGDFGG